MAIKKRTPVDKAAQSAAIEAFGEAAEQPTAPAARAATTPRKSTPPSATKATEWPDDVARTLLIRYPDPELPAMLAELARLEERKQHPAAVRALRRGLEVLIQEARDG